MLSYRHGFHAGNAADVLKHSVLSFVLDYLVKKPKPLYLLDTHAGAGAYDLTDAMAHKTGEHAQGIGRFDGLTADGPALCAAYLKALTSLRKTAAAYPGSPAFLQHFQREGDRLDLAELHPTDHLALSGRFNGKERVTVHREDGLALMIARLPPPERRGLVLIDPSYEVKSDYEQVVARLAGAHKRFATGVYLLWYPVIDRDRTEVFLARLAETGMRRQLRIELCQEADRPGRGMTGSGLIAVNPPWTLEAAARDGLVWLSKTLDAGGPSRVEWLVPE